MSQKSAMAPSANPFVETPMVESGALSKAAGWYVTPPPYPYPYDGFLNRRSRIFLKLENLQPSGSFKSRGIGYYVKSALAKSASPDHTHFYSSSGGNAGLACVHAAHFFSRPATVVVPMSTKPLMLAKIRAAGATEVLQHGANWKEADTYLREVVLPGAERRGETGIYVPPFDHPDIWTGHATLIDELNAQFAAKCGQGSTPDVLVCSVGGGGLLNGLVEGIDRLNGEWRDTTVLAVETKGADSLAESLEQGEQITLPAITSLATSLGATKVCDRTYELATTREQIKSAVLSDDEAAMGCWRLAEDERLIVELACGVNVALAYGGRLEKALGRRVHPQDKVVIVLCGGSAITIDQLTEFKRSFGHLGDEVSQGEKETIPSAATNGFKH